jgi:hypothetical protein
MMRTGSKLFLAGPGVMGLHVDGDLSFGSDFTIRMVFTASRGH